MRIIISVLLVLLSLATQIFTDGNNGEPKTPENVDINKSMGMWYEIARINNWMEDGLVGVTATYTMLPNGDIEMINAGYKHTLEGKHKSVKGTAWLIDKVSNTKLRACFFWPFYGNFLIMEVGKDYEYAVVGHPKRKYLWLLSRQPQMDETLYQEILLRLQEQGYDVGKIMRVEQKMQEEQAAPVEEQKLLLQTETPL